MALSSNSIFTRMLLTFRFPTFTLKVTDETYERHTMWHEIFAPSTSAIRKRQKNVPAKKIPQKFNVSLTSELSKEPLLSSLLNTCQILDIASPLAIFRQLCQIRYFCQICHFHQNRHSLRGLTIFRHFYQICHYR